ncbi:MAG: metal-dependent hydrolase [Clostridiales bacterium]
MTGRTHAAAAIVLATAITHQYTSEVVLAAFIGGLLPDIDTPKSLVSDLIPGIDNVWNFIKKRFLSIKTSSSKKANSLRKGFLKNILKIISFVFTFLHDLFKHRGILTHSAITLIIFWIILVKYDNMFMYALFLGIISHHILDMLTNQGLEYLYPIIDKRLGIKIITTGSTVESALYYIIIIIGIFYYFYTDNLDIMQIFQN